MTIPLPSTQVLPGWMMPEGMRCSTKELVADLHRVPRVVAALIARHHVEALGQQIDDLALALVAPLRADDYDDF